MSVAAPDQWVIDHPTPKSCVWGCGSPNTHPLQTITWPGLSTQGLPYPVQVGNLEGHELKVTAQGPETMAFERAETLEATHCIRLQTAGMYLVQVTVNGHPLSGWPRPLHVTAAASEAARSASARPTCKRFCSQAV